MRYYFCAIATTMKRKQKPEHRLPPPAHSMPHGLIVAAPTDEHCLDTLQLMRLEQCFRDWVHATPRSDVRLSRRRILLIFLLIRYTGAKLNEVLNLQPFEDIDTISHSVTFRSLAAAPDKASRRVPLSTALSEEIRGALGDADFAGLLQNELEIDPAFVRRKFYERAEDCTFAKNLCGPEMIRKARAVELMQKNLPLSAVQLLLGHSTPNLTSSYVSFSSHDIDRITRHFMDMEASRTSSARNSFYGKVTAVEKGDIQSRIEMLTMSGLSLNAIITNHSLEHLGLKTGALITAEVKAPWVMVQKKKGHPVCSADNMLEGVIEQVSKSSTITEYVIRLIDGAMLCAIITTHAANILDAQPGDPVWAYFNCFSVVIYTT